MEGFLNAEMQSEYAIAPANWTVYIIGGISELIRQLPPK